LYRRLTAESSIEKWSVSEGYDMSDHPKHDSRLPYSPEDIIKLRKGITEGIEHLPPKPSPE